MPNLTLLAGLTNRPPLVANRAFDPALIPIGSPLDAGLIAADFPGGRSAHIIAAAAASFGLTFATTAAPLSIAAIFIAAAPAGDHFPAAAAIGLSAVPASGALDLGLATASAALGIAVTATTMTLFGLPAAASAAALIFLCNDRQRHRQSGDTGEQHELTH